MPVPKWLLTLAFFFVLFLIFTQPDGAGNIANQFGQFVIDFFRAVAEFLTGLVEGASESQPTDPGPSDFTQSSSGVETYGSNAPYGSSAGDATAFNDTHTHTHTHTD